MPQNDQGMGLPRGSGAPQQAPAAPNTPPLLSGSRAGSSLLESHSQMLGVIAALIDPWVMTPETTTEDAVRLALAELYELKAERLREQVCNSGGSDE